MARVTGSVLANLSGKLGNLSARTRNGRIYLAARPGPGTDAPTPAAVDAPQWLADSVP